MGLFSKIKAGLLKTRQAMMSKLSKLLHSFTKIDEDLFEQLEETLIMSDVGVETSLEICERLRKMIKEQGITDPKEIMRLIHEIVSDMMGEDKGLDLSTSPSVIMVIGVNGAGKTTTIGKLCHKLKGEGKKVLVAAADTFRAAAIDQLQVWTERAGVDIVKHAEGSDAAAVVYDAITAAKARHCDVVIVDTAGRLHNKKNLMDELAKINRIVSQQAQDCAKEILLVLDATTGQNAVNQAKLFKEVADITGIVLTKLDGTAKGGIVISIKNELDIPVKLIGLGEKIGDLQDFSSRDFVNALFGDEVLDGEVNLDDENAEAEDAETEEVSEEQTDEIQNDAVAEVSDDKNETAEESDKISDDNDETTEESEETQSGDNEPAETAGESSDDENNNEEEASDDEAVSEETAEEKKEEPVKPAYKPIPRPNAVLYMHAKVVNTVNSDEGKDTDTAGSISETSVYDDEEGTSIFDTIASVETVSVSEAEYIADITEDQKHTLEDTVPDYIAESVNETENEPESDDAYESEEVSEAENDTSVSEEAEDETSDDESEAVDETSEDVTEEAEESEVSGSEDTDESKESENSGEEEKEKKKGFFSRLFGKKK